MKQKNIVKALEKEGWKVSTSESGYRHFCVSDKNKCDWFTTEYNPDPRAIKVQRHSESDDMMTDYFPGVWCETIKSLIYFMKN